MKVVTFKNPKPMLLTLLRLLGGQVADHPTTAEQMRENVQRELRLRQLLRDEKQDAGRGLVAPQNANPTAPSSRQRRKSRTVSRVVSDVPRDGFKTCQNCGRQFHDTRKNRKFCGDNCRKRHHEALRREVVR